MTTETEQNGDQAVATRSEQTEAAPTRRFRDLGEYVLGGWPFPDLAWPFRGLDSTAAPIRVEELVDNGQLIIRAELPGVDPDKDIEVSVDDGVLTIKAERRQEKEEKDDGRYRSEFHYGSFMRRIQLPEGTQAEVISAQYRNGVLEVRMPQPVGAASADSRRIPIERS